MSVSRIGAAILLGTLIGTPGVRGQLSEAASPLDEVFAPFAVVINGDTVALTQIMIGVMPDEHVTIEPLDGGAPIHVTWDDGAATPAGGGSWRGQAPSAPGFSEATIEAGGGSITVTFAVLRPMTDVRDGSLNGYRIGEYRTPGPSRAARYGVPRGFIEATPDDWDRRVSPRFRLGQFLCKDPGDPRYLLVTPELLAKLELILDELVRVGIDGARLNVMSGFRTPAYNRAIGNTTSFSRHLYGDAADIFVDVNGDGDMDDVNGDGRRDIRDARWLADLVERIAGSGLVAEPGSFEPGGLATYRRNAAHGPFVHVDTRGRAARW